MTTRRVHIIGVAVFAALAGCSSSGHDAATPTSPSTSPTTTSTRIHRLASPPITAASNAAAYVRRTLDAAIPPPGPRPFTSPPPPLLTTMFQHVAEKNLVALHRLYTVPGGALAIAEFLKANPPDGFA